MELPFNINGILTNPIEIVDGNTTLGYLPFGVDITQLNCAKDHQKLSYLIDVMGRASAKAQNLGQPITSSTKMKASDQKLYILKNTEGNNGLGLLLGILKVGYKNLFLYNLQHQQIEMKPLCVLDFYVHESQQRKGYGRRLFEYMLSRENVLPHHLAVDRPSPKFLSFLAKHYGLTDVLPQVNNYVVFTNFFNDRTDTKQFNFNRRNYTLSPIVNKETHQKPPSAIVTMKPQSSSMFNANNPDDSPNKRITVNNNAEYKEDSINSTKHIRINTPTTMQQLKQKGSLNIPLSLPTNNHTKTSQTNTEAPIKLPRNVDMDKVKWYLPLHNDAQQTQLSDSRKLNQISNNVEKSILKSDPVPIRSILKTSPPMRHSHSSVNQATNHSASLVPRNQSSIYPNPNTSSPNLPYSLNDYSYNVGLSRHYSHTRLW